MKEKKSTKKNVSNDEKQIETNFNELYEKARGMQEFEKYDDFELKEKLLNLVFSLDDLEIEKDDEIEGKAITEEEKKERKFKKIILKLEHALKENSPKKSSTTQKYKIISQKYEFLGTIKESLPTIYDVDSIHSMLFKLAKSIDIYNNNIFWDFNNYNDRDFRTFKRDIKLAFYFQSGNVFTRFWDIISGQRKEKIDKSDPFSHIQIYPKDKWYPLYGSNYYKAKPLDDSWVPLCFGITNIIPSYIPLGESFKYSLLAIISNLSKTFDELFKWLNVEFTEINDADNEFSRTEHVKNEGLLFKLVSESFSSVIRVLTTFEHITTSLPLNENHPFRSNHVIYFITWIYVKWINFIEKTFKESKNYVTPDGETGKVSIKDIFDRVKNEVDEQLVEIDFEEDLSVFYSYFSEREEILKKMDYYVGFLPELKRRTKILLSSLLGDVVKDFFEKKNYLFHFHIDERGHIHFDTLIKTKGVTIIEKIVSLFKSFKKDTQISVPLPSLQESKPKGVETAPSVGKISYSIQKEYSSYSRTLGDLLIIVTNIATVLNENFSAENQFRTRFIKQQDKYSYLSSNTFFTENEKDVSFEQVMQIQDCFDLIFTVKTLGESIIQSIKNKEIPRILYMKTDELEESLARISVAFKDTSAALGILTQNRNKYDEYVTLLNRFQIVYTEFQKISKLSE
ncbi:MAG: hypothetical protein OEV44_06020 [Spirochaetota bacterium]|nr:hypothetical protein [Spirochaetota bacterium]